MSQDNDLSNFSMLDLFRNEVTEQCKVLTDGMLALEQDPCAAALLEALMRASHSIKGAARLVGVDPVVRVAHLMEDAFVSAQKGEITLGGARVDALLAGVDMISAVSRLSEQSMSEWEAANAGALDAITGRLRGIRENGDAQPRVRSAPAGEGGPLPQAPKKAEAPPAVPVKPATEGNNDDRVLRVTATRWNEIMGLAGEVKVETGWLHPYVASMWQIKRHQTEMVEILDSLREAMDNLRAHKDLYRHLLSAQSKAAECRKLISDKATEFDVHDRRLNNLCEKLHHETIMTRMRPFSEAVHGFHRMVRDVSRSLGKKVALEINGLSTQVGRDVLDKIEAPLNHMLRNAIDHGIETPEERTEAGKPEQAVIKLSAAHYKGMLSIIVEDDGRGIDLDRLREKVAAKGHTTPEMAAELSEKELLEFLFLPNFSTRDTVTDISGRGVGLDVVLDTIQKMRGIVHTSTAKGKGTRFHMQIPIILSVLSTLIVEIAGENYAFPTARINGVATVPARLTEVIEDRQYINVDGRLIGIIGASYLFGFGPQSIDKDEFPVVIIGDNHNAYGVVVDRLIGLKDLAVQPLDNRLGKVQDIGSAALLEDGSSVLIIDVDDLVVSVDAKIKKGDVGKVKRKGGDDAEVSRKHILVVDDSLTVREVERNLLERSGFMVDVAVDGMDGWNTLRSRGKYDLVITDIDMPRLDGIELVRMIKSDRKFSSVPVIIVSYKERAEDRKRGFEAGADYYLTKGSFHDNTFIDAVIELIGEAKE